MKVTDFVWRTALKKAAQSIEERGQQDEVIVIRKDGLQRVYLVASYSTAPTEVRSCIATGNQGYPARFLLCHFYEKRPITELRKLALLTLHCAAMESEGRIGGGFDLMLLRDGEAPEWESIEENALSSDWEPVRRTVYALIYP